MKRVDSGPAGVLEFLARPLHSGCLRLDLPGCSRENRGVHWLVLCDAGVRGRLRLRRRELGRQLLEEVSGVLLRGRVDEARAELGELAADLGVDLIGEDRRVLAVLSELHVGLALGESGDAALPLALDGIAFGRDRVHDLHVGIERRLDGPHLGLNLGDHLMIALLFEALTALDAVLQDLGVVQRLPHNFARGRDAMFTGQFHKSVSIDGGTWPVPRGPQTWR